MAKTVINNTKEQERKARKIYINKVKRFARSKAGLKILKQLAPEAALMIEAHPDWLDIAQYYNDPRLSGNYRVDFYDRLENTVSAGLFKGGGCCFSAFGHRLVWLIKHRIIIRRSTDRYRNLCIKFFLYHFEFIKNPCTAFRTAQGL